MALNKKELLIFIISLFISSGLIFSFKIYLEFEIDLLITSIVIIPLILALYFTVIYFRSSKDYQIRGEFIYYIGLVSLYTIIGLLLAASSLYDYKLPGLFS